MNFELPVYLLSSSRLCTGIKKKKISKKLIKKKLNNGERTKEEDTPVIGDDDYCNTD